MDLHEFKSTFDLLLTEYSQQKTDDAKKLVDNDILNQMIDYIQTFMLSWGKRIRPYALYLTYKWLGWKNDGAIMRFGMIFELLHNFALIHDDIIDKSEKRHNIQTMHYYAHNLLWEKNMHIATSQAILLWDLLFSRVYQLEYENHDFDEILLYLARQNIHSMIQEVILGEMIDVHMVVWEPADEKLIDKKNQYKTASYTFTRPMLTWAILTWAHEDVLSLVRELWNCIGMAFQVRDDLKDILGTEVDKRVFSDIQEGQQTYFTNYVFTKWSENDKQLLKQSLGKNLTDIQIKELQKMFYDNGAIDFVKSLIKKYAEQAQHILDKISFEDESCKLEFGTLIKKIWNLSV